MRESNDNANAEQGSQVEEYVNANEKLYKETNNTASVKDYHNTVISFSN